MHAVRGEKVFKKMTPRTRMLFEVRRQGDPIPPCTEKSNYIGNNEEQISGSRANDAMGPRSCLEDNLHPALSNSHPALTIAHVHRGTRKLAEKNFSGKTGRTRASHSERRSLDVAPSSIVSRRTR